MPSNRAIMPRADLQHGRSLRRRVAVAAHKLPDDVECHADTWSGPLRGRLNCKVGCSPRDALFLCIKMRPCAKDVVGEPDLAALTVGWHARRRTPSQDVGCGGIRIHSHHLAAVGLDLGAGLDTRMVGIVPSDTVDWSIPGRDRRSRALDTRSCQRSQLRVPAVSPHLPFPQQEMAFNSYTSLAVWASKVIHGPKSFAGLLKFPGANGPYELEGWNPKLKLIREFCLPGTRGCRVSDRRSPLHPISRLKHNLVPKGTIVLVPKRDDRPSLPPLGPGRSRKEVTPRG
jgi:hypothetical protein